MLPAWPTKPWMRPETPRRFETNGVASASRSVQQNVTRPRDPQPVDGFPDTPKAWKVSLRVRNEPLVCAGVLSKERRQRMQIVHRTEARADQLAIVWRDVGGV